jgi:hypothetical protein
VWPNCSIERKAGDQWHECESNSHTTSGGDSSHLEPSWAHMLRYVQHIRWSVGPHTVRILWNSWLLHIGSWHGWNQLSLTREEGNDCKKIAKQIGCEPCSKPIDSKSVRMCLHTAYTLLMPLRLFLNHGRPEKGDNEN